MVESYKYLCKSSVLYMCVKEQNVKEENFCVSSLFIFSSSLEISSYGPTEEREKEGRGGERRDGEKSVLGQEIVRDMGFAIRFCERVPLDRWVCLFGS